MKIEFISIIIAVIPTIYFLFFFHKKDKTKKNPINKVFPIFFLGIFSIIPVVFIETVIDNINDEYISDIFISAFITSFITAALCEEGAKFIIIKKFVYNNADFRSAMDGIIYTTAASLGFACIENINYTLSMGADVGYLRAFTAVPLHACASGIMGYYIGCAKRFHHSKIEESNLLRKGIFTAVLIHGSYNFFLILSESSSEYSILNILIYPILFISFKILHKRISEINAPLTINSAIDTKIPNLKQSGDKNRFNTKFLKDDLKKENFSEKVKKGYQKGNLYN